MLELLIACLSRLQWLRDGLQVQRYLSWRSTGHHCGGSLVPNLRNGFRRLSLGWLRIGYFVVAFDASVEVDQWLHFELSQGLSVFASALVSSGSSGFLLAVVRIHVYSCYWVDFLPAFVNSSWDDSGLDSQLCFCSVKSWAHDPLSSWLISFSEFGFLLVHCN